MPKKRAVRRTYADFVKGRLRQKRKLYRERTRVVLRSRFDMWNAWMRLKAIQDFNKRLTETGMDAFTFNKYVASMFRSRVLRKAVRELLLPDLKDRNIILGAEQELRLSMPRLLWQIFRNALMLRVSRYDPFDRIRELHDRVRLFRTIWSLVFGFSKPFLITFYRNSEVELHFYNGIENWLRDPERIGAVREAFEYLITELVTMRKRLVIPEEEYERLKKWIGLLFQLYTATGRRKPCRRSNYILRLTPLTFHFMRGYAVRVYVVRWTRVDRLMNKRVVIEKPIDVHYARMKWEKYRDEVFSSMVVAGKSDSLSGDEEIAISRDERRDARILLRVYEAIYRGDRIREEFMREIAGYGNNYGGYHCSVYVGLYPHVVDDYEKNKKYRLEKEVEKTYRLLG